MNIYKSWIANKRPPPKISLSSRQRVEYAAYTHEKKIRPNRIRNSEKAKIKKNQSEESARREMAMRWRRRRRSSTDSSAAYRHREREAHTSVAPLPAVRQSSHKTAWNSVFSLQHYWCDVSVRDARMIIKCKSQKFIENRNVHYVKQHQRCNDNSDGNDGQMKTRIKNKCNYNMFHFVHKYKMIIFADITYTHTHSIVWQRSINLNQSNL